MTSRALWIVAALGLGSCGGAEPVESAAEEISTVDPARAYYDMPAEIPPGQVGRDSCTFAFPSQCHPEDHSPYTCWEHPVGHDGWVRQEVVGMHCDSGVRGCALGPGDIYTIRLCREGGAGQVSPCGAMTGGNGCAQCGIRRDPVCH